MLNTVRNGTCDSNSDSHSHLMDCSTPLSSPVLQVNELQNYRKRQNQYSLQLLPILQPERQTVILGSFQGTQFPTFCFLYQIVLNTCSFTLHLLAEILCCHFILLIGLPEQLKTSSPCDTQKPLLLYVLPIKW